MANQHYYFDDEIEVTVKVKIKNIGISNYQHLTEEKQKEALEDFKKEISKHLQFFLVGSYGQQDVLDHLDWFSFDVETE
jgi:hypothetical protein